MPITVTTWHVQNFAQADKVFADKLDFVAPMLAIRKRALTLAAILLAASVGCRDQPTTAPPAGLEERTFLRPVVGSTEHITVRVRATKKVPAAMLEVLERTLEVRLVGRERRSELAFWLDEAMAPDPERAEVAVELVPLDPGLDPKRFVWTWPDLFQMSRPGVLEVSPLAREMPSRSKTEEGDVGVIVGKLHGGSHTAIGKLLCNSQPAPHLRVAVAGFGATSRADGTFSVVGTFPGTPGTVFVGYEGQIPVTPGPEPATTHLQIMDDFHFTRSDRVDQTPATTGDVFDFGDLTLPSTDCILWRRGIRALTHYFNLMGAAPPAGQLQIKRLSTSASAPHTPYAYIVAPEDMAVNSPTTLFHEFGHSVRHVADGAHTHWDYDNFRFVYARGHDGGQVTNKGFVFNEGWANYWEAVVIGIPVPVHPGAPTTDASFVDFNEDLVGARLQALSVPVGDAFMVKLLLDNPGAIHTLAQFEQHYCAASGPPRPAFCSASVPTRPVAACPTGYSDDGTTCRLNHIIGKPSFSRGVGTAPDDCGPGRGYDAGLCYALCPDGFRGVGTMCWQNCPAGYHDDGAVCRRDAQVIGSNNQACPWHDRCGAAWAKGCSVCPEGFANDGCACRRNAHIFAKATTNRGAGTIPVGCRAGRQWEAGLCYASCPAGFTGIGAVCWGSCPMPFVDTGATCYRAPNLFSDDPVIPP